VPAAVKCSSLIKSLRLHVNFGKEPGRYIAGQQLVSVLREYRVVPHRVIHAQTHELPKQQVVVDLLNQQPFRTNQAENPQKQGPQTVLWRSRRPPGVCIQRIELPAQRPRNPVYQFANRAQSR
jgi:hypothetical protein